MRYCTQQILITRTDGLLKKTANYDVRQKSVDQKQCNNFECSTDTDNFAVKNVSMLSTGLVENFGHNCPTHFSKKGTRL